jgi:hypothetical protein
MLRKYWYFSRYIAPYCGGCGGWAYPTAPSPPRGGSMNQPHLANGCPQ